LKTEFEAKRYEQNTEGHTTAQDDPTLHKNDTSGSSDGIFSLAVRTTAILMCWPIYTPSTLLFEVAGLCGSAEECKKPRRSYPIHPSAKFLIHRLVHILCVRLVLGLAYS
jgi:hypothetical protein